MAITIPIITEFKGKGIDKAIKEFKQLEGAGKKAAFAIKKAALPATVALAGIAAMATKALAAGEAVSTANARISQINNSMGLFGKSTQKVTDRLIKLAETTGMQTGMDNLSIKATQAKLLTFSNLAKTADKLGGAFDRTMRAALDMAAAGFGNAESNAVQLGKALQDPIKGITALAKSGVTFTAQEKEKIKALVESNRLLEAQDMVLQALETQVGGTAIATANDTDKMKESFAQFSQTLGLVLLPILQKITPSLLAISQWAKNNTGVILAVGGVIGGVAVAILAANAAMKIWSITTAIFSGIQAAFNAVMLLNPIFLMVAALVAVGAALVILQAKFNIFGKVFEAVGATAGRVFNAMKAGFAGVVSAITGYISGLVAVYKRLFNGIASIWNNTIGRLSFKIPGWVPGIGGKGFDVPNIPMLAAGGIVSSPTLALIGESGPEAVVPLSGRNAPAMGNNITINVNGGDPQSVVNALRTYMRQNGSVPIKVSNLY